jgi:hypothetical protein
LIFKAPSSKSEAQDFNSTNKSLKMGLHWKLMWKNSSEAQIWTNKNLTPYKERQ